MAKHIDVDRSFTQSKAQSYGLTGFVENTPNNKVSGESVAGLHRQFRVLRKPG
jgi:hypothetical protein